MFNDNFIAIRRGGSNLPEPAVPVSIRDAKHSKPDQNWIQGKFREYVEDLSRMGNNTGIFPMDSGLGERPSELTMRWFVDDFSHPLIIVKDHIAVGFALVSRPLILQHNSIDFRMADFFVIEKSRRLGVGRDAAQLIFNRFAGTWEVTEFQYNKPAIDFWRAIVADYTGGRFQETALHGEVRQVFKSASPRAVR